MNAKEILMHKATENNDGFLSGQVKWIVEAMEDYAALQNKDYDVKFKNRHLEAIKDWRQAAINGYKSEEIEQSEGIWKTEYDLAVKEISELQKQLKDAEQEIRDLNNELNYK